MVISSQENGDKKEEPPWVHTGRFFLSDMGLGQPIFGVCIEATAAVDAHAPNPGAWGTIAKCIQLFQQAGANA